MGIQVPFPEGLSGCYPEMLVEWNVRLFTRLFRSSLVCNFLFDFIFV